MRDAIEQQIPELGIGREAEAGVACDERGLHGQTAAGVLQAECREVGDFALILVELIAQEVALSGDRQSGTDLRGQQPRLVGNLEAVVGAADEEGHTIAVVQDVLEVAEAMVLAGVIVKRRGQSVGRLDAQAVADEVAGDEERVGAGGSAVVESRLHRSVTAAVQRQRAAGFERTALGGEVDDACAAQSVFGRKAACDQLQRGDQARRQSLAEEADAIGEDHSVQAELQAVVIATDVELAEGILGGVGNLQHHLVELHVVAPGRRLYGRGVEGIGRGARLGVDAGPLLVQVLGGDDDGGNARTRLIGDLCKAGGARGERWNRGGPCWCRAEMKSAH